MLNYFLKMMDGQKVNFNNIQAGDKLENIKDSRMASIFQALDKNGNKILDKNEIQTFLEKVKSYASKGKADNLGDKEYTALQKALGEDFKSFTKEELLNFIKHLSENNSGIQTINTHPNGEVEYLYEDGSRIMTHPDGMTEYLDREGNSFTKDKDGNIINKTIKKGDITISARILDDGGTEYTIYDENTGTTNIQTEDNDGNVISETTIENGVETKKTYLDNGVKEIQTTKDGVTTIEYQDKNGNPCDKAGHPLETEAPQEEIEEKPKQTKIIVQNGESIAALAKKFGCTPQEIIDANPGLVKGKAPNQYFLVGEEINIPREISDEALKGRQTKEQAVAAYTSAIEKQHAIQEEIAARKPISWTERNYNTFEEIARQLLKREGLENPTKKQLEERIEDLKKSNPTLKDGELKGKKIIANVNEGMYNRIAQRGVQQKEYKQAVATRQNAETLAKQFYDIADNNSGNTSMKKMQKLLDEKITADNIVDFLDAYEKAKHGDSSIIDTVTSEIGASGSKEQKQVLRTIMAKLIEAARKAGVSEGDIKKANDDFEASIKKEYESLGGAFRRTNPLEMEKAIDFLRGAIAAKKTDNVEEMTDSEAISAFNEDFAATDAEAQQTYKEARSEEGWTARVGDTVCGWFGCTTIEDMDKKLGKNAEAVKRLASAKTEEEFKTIYKEIFGIEFDKNKIAARDAALSNYIEAQMLNSTINVISDILKNAGNLSYNDLRNEIKTKLQLDDATVDAIIASYADSLDLPANSDDEKRTLMLQFLREVQTNSVETYRELTKGKTLEQMGADLELLTKSAFGTNDIVKDVVQFNQNMVMTEMITEGAFEVGGTIALMLVPGLGGAAAARLAAITMKWGNKAVKLTNTLKKAEKVFKTANKVQKGETFTSGAAKKGTQIGSQMVNAGVATATVDITNGDEVKEVVRKTLMNMSFAGVGASSSMLAPKLMQAFGINKTLATEIAEEIINAAGSYGVTKIAGDDYGSADAFIDFATGLIMSRISHVKTKSDIETPVLDKASSGGNATPSSVKVGEAKAAKIQEEINNAVSNPNVSGEQLANLKQEANSIQNRELRRKLIEQIDEAAEKLPASERNNFYNNDKINTQKNVDHIFDKHSELTDADTRSLDEYIKNTDDPAVLKELREKLNQKEHTYGGVTENYNRLRNSIDDKLAKLEPTPVKTNQQQRDDVVTMLNEKKQTGKGINEKEFKQICEYLSTIDDEAQLKELKELLQGNKMVSAHKKQLKEMLASKTESLAAMKQQARIKQNDTPDEPAAVKREEPAGVKPDEEIKPENIKEDINAIPDDAIPKEHRRLWNDCKERISGIMTEISDLASAGAKSIKTRGNALLNKCEILITDLKTIANSVTGTAKAKIQNIIHNLQTMVKQKLAKLDSSFRNIGESHPREAGIHKVPTSIEETALQYGKKTVIPANSKIVLGEWCVLDLSDPQIMEILKDGRVHTVGRSGDIKIPSIYETVSRKHLEIQLVGDRIIVRDISSSGSKIIEELPVINENELVREAGNNGKPVNKDYVRTSRETRAYLDEQIESGAYTQDLDSYIETMNEAHRIANAGKDGSHEWYSQVGEKKERIQHPGEFRKTEQDQLKNNRYEEAEQVEAIARKYGDPYRVKKQEQRVKLEGIPEEFQPKDMYISGYAHFYPATAGLKNYYYKEMHRTAKETLELIERGASEKEILHKLAEHYQYAANARPYRHINNSLFMNEINTLLTKAGMKTMPHGMLDHAAQRLQPDAFKKYFTDEYYRTALDT